MIEEDEKTLTEIDEEIRALKTYLSKNSIQGGEYDTVVGPLADTVKNLQFRKKLSWLVRRCLKMTLCLLFLFLIFQVSWFHKIFSVFGRVVLLQLLPWWDWTRIYYSDCILTNPFYMRRTLGEEDCKLCESLKSLERLRDVSPKVIWDGYLVNDLPFIVLDGMNDWPVMNTDNFWFDNITEIYLSEEQEGLEPCEFTTNLRIPSNDLRKFLRTIHDPNVWHWFGHWENCDKKGAKALRPFYRRPYFMPSMVDLSDSNWVMVSSNYFSKMYHLLDFSTELLGVAQIRGWSRIRLTPREPCNYVCPQLLDTLKEGQMVALTNFMWEFEYTPGEGTDNLAIAVGGDWN